MKIEHHTRRLLAHLQRWRIAYLAMLLLGIVALFISHHYVLGLNTTASLPHRLFLIHKNATVTRGAYVAFRWHGNGLYPPGITFVKIVAGLPGDRVSTREREFFVNGASAGMAKHLSRSGTPLELGPTGIIPPGHYYVKAPHPDSLDSRYRLTGWIPQAQIIGRAYALF